MTPLRTRILLLLALTSQGIGTLAYAQDDSGTLEEGETDTQAPAPEDAAEPAAEAGEGEAPVAPEATPTPKKPEAPDPAPATAAEFEIDDGLNEITSIGRIEVKLPPGL